MEKRLLIIDSSYLIAMEMERILSQALDSECILLTPAKLVDGLSAGTFDAVFLDADYFDRDGLSSAMNLLLQQTDNLVLTTTNSALKSAHSGRATYPMLHKPIHDEQLLALMHRLLADKPPQSS